MNRCFSLFACACALAGAAQAQVRDFPAAALRGVLQVTQPPEVLLDGRADRLSPGARIRNAGNLLVMPASLVGQERLVVNYVRDAGGLVHEVWLLTPDEARVRRARADGGTGSFWDFLFGPSAPAQPRGPRDDGKTPFEQLPRYGGSQP